jgi:4-hydroxy-4-methyl-2-oxoglutarate aldolase
MFASVNWNSDMTLQPLPDLPSDLSAASVYEAIGKRGEVGPGIGAMVPGVRLQGFAYTVRCVVGDARAVWHALAEAPAGSVVVIDAGGTPHATAIGGTSARLAFRRGIAGFLTNGAVRDLMELRALQFPVFAAGASVRGTLKSHPGQRQVPVSIGAAVVKPGDFVFGDDDGVVVVPNEEVATLAERVARQRAREIEIDSRVEAGEDILEILGLR